jgi:hypothetical protein
MCHTCFMRKKLLYITTLLVLTPSLIFVNAEKGAYGEVAPKSEQAVRAEYENIIPAKKPFIISKARVGKNISCINNVTYFEVRYGGKKIPLLYSYKITSGDQALIRTGAKIDVASKSVKYFCIKSVLPLIVHHGYMVDIIK